MSLQTRNPEQELYEHLQSSGQTFDDDLTRENIDLEVLAKVDDVTAAHLQVIPLKVEKDEGGQPDTLVLVTNLTENGNRISVIEEKLQCHVKLIYTTKENFRNGFAYHYGSGVKNIGTDLLRYNEELTETDQGPVPEDDDLADIHKADSPLVRKVNDILGMALAKGASDIHIHPQEMKVLCFIVLMVNSKIFSHFTGFVNQTKCGW